MSRALAAQLLLAVGLRVLVLQPERCPAPDLAGVEGAIDAAVGWFGANHLGDGRWRYRYDITEDVDLGGYNIVRHAGVLVALEQAAAAGVGGAAEAADAGWPFVEARLRPVDAGTAFVDDADPAGTARADTGASALATSAWTYRLQRQGVPVGAAPPALVGLGRLLVAQVEPSGAVAGARALLAHRRIPERSRFTTGEVSWALQRLAHQLPGQGFDEPAARTLRYLVAERDRVERWFPAIADHWAAYALDDVADPGALPEQTARYRATLAGRFAVQVRWESQRRTGSRFSSLTRARPATGAAIGTLGEGLGRLATSAPVVARDGLQRQLGCAAGLLVARQVRDEAGAFPAPARAAGSWPAGGITQMDDQQHALSALLVYRSLRTTPPPSPPPGRDRS